MAETKFVIARAINGITLNGREYVCDEKDEPILFDSQDLALAFLKEKGFQFPSGPVEVCLYRAQGKVHDIGDFFVCVSLDVPQKHG